MPTVKNLNGLTFGRLTVIRDAKRRELPDGRRRRNRYVLCRCECGQQTSVRVDHLRSGKTRSCGCLAADVSWHHAWAGAAGSEGHARVLAESRSAEQSAPAVYDSAPAATSVDGRTRIERAWGMAEGEYQQRLTAQNGVCGICREIPFKPFHVDHDHKTGEIRGLLCSPCNTGLGFFRDDVGRLLRAIEYLSNHKAATAKPAA